MPLIKATLGMEVDSGPVVEVLGGDTVAQALWDDLVHALAGEFAARGISNDSIEWESPGVYISQEEQERVLFQAVFTPAGNVADTPAGRLYQELAIKLSVSP